MGTTLRRATPADAPTIVRFNAALARESEGKELDPAVLAAGVGAALADPHKGRYTLAVRDGGEAVGQLMVTFEWSDWRNGWFWWVQSVYVRADARRGGVFRALFEGVRREAEADPAVVGIRLYFERDNGAALAAYRSLGMADAHYGVMEICPLGRRGT